MGCTALVSSGQGSWPLNAVPLRIRRPGLVSGRPRGASGSALRGGRRAGGRRGRRSPRLCPAPCPETASPYRGTAVSIVPLVGRGPVARCGPERRAPPALRFACVLLDAALRPHPPRFGLTPCHHRPGRHCAVASRPRRPRPRARTRRTQRTRSAAWPSGPRAARRRPQRAASSGRVFLRAQPAIGDNAARR